LNFIVISPPPDQDDPFQKTVEAFDQPFQKVLCSVGNLLRLARGYLRENDESQRHNPRDDHGIGDREAERPPDFLGLLR
jgi:hypothetical protein